MTLRRVTPGTADWPNGGQSLDCALMHGPLKRSLSALLGIWFLLVFIGPETVHSCPVHSSVSGTHSGHGGAASTQHHMKAGGHGAHEPVQGAQQSSAPKTSTLACSCPGDCAATTLAALKTPATTVPPLPAVLRGRAAASVDSPADPHPDLVLPFAIGPPAPALA